MLCGQRLGKGGEGTEPHTHSVPVQTSCNRSRSLLRAASSGTVVAACHDNEIHQQRWAGGGVGGNEATSTCKGGGKATGSKPEAETHGAGGSPSRCPSSGGRAAAGGGEGGEGARRRHDCAVIVELR